MSTPLEHEPVLLKEVLAYLAPAPGQIIVDANLGQAGHTLELLQKLGVDGLVIGIERDSQMLEAARRRIEAAHFPRSNFTLIEANHVDLPTLLPSLLADRSESVADGVLFDLGPSTPQLLDPARGFSWTHSEALDMRMSPGTPGPTAADIVNSWREDELARIFREHADERWAKRIALRIVEQRRRRPIRSGAELGEIVAAAIPRAKWPPRTHPATRVFLALRVEVNAEYRDLELALPAAFSALKPGGRLVVISFHSGEDRMVKTFMRGLTTPVRTPGPLPDPDIPTPAVALTRKPITPGEEEMNRNPRSRSARLRAIQKRPLA